MHDVEPWTTIEAEDIYTCPECEGTGWKDVKKPIAATIHCHCAIGKALRKEAHEQVNADWQAAKDAGLWEHPDQWPW